MIGFVPSLGLVRRTINGLPWFGGLRVRHELREMGHSIEDLAPRWGEDMRGAIMQVAHRVSHGCHNPLTSAGEPYSFVIIRNGSFVPEVARCIEQNTCFIGADRPEMRELAQEFLKRSGEDPLAWVHFMISPILRMSMVKDSLVAHVAPYVEPPRDPNWVPATVLKC